MTHNPPIFAFQVAGIIGMSHCTWLWLRQFLRWILFSGTDLFSNHIFLVRSVIYTSFLAKLQVFHILLLFFMLLIFTVNLAKRSQQYQAIA
jgi:hypothetical protein